MHKTSSRYKPGYVGYFFAKWAVVAGLVFSAVPVTALANEVRVAVASNFLMTARLFEKEFFRSSGHKMLISSGSTGKLYAQILHGAPFDVFLAADEERPQLLEKAGKTHNGSRFTYAVGRLSVWSPTLGKRHVDCRKLLRAGKMNHLAIANPKTAPYGKATKQTLTKMGLWDKLKPRYVRGENIAQTLQYVVSGNAEMGFVALSQVAMLKRKNYKNNKNYKKMGCNWTVPASYHSPLNQQAVLLMKAADNPVAISFMAFLASDKARTIIKSSGYQLN